ncbi:hypothetical protein MKW94_020630, partial [Papaver nudicaule]|nr:hypothetical protein [Papaver nudicaule]
LQARAELVQKVKETEEYSKSVKKLEQACQSMDLLEQTLRIHNDNLVERINSIRLTGRSKIYL